MAITKGMFELGSKAVAFDKKFHRELEDFLALPGFARALRLTMRIKPGGSLWGAPDCAPWGWIGRSTTKRSSTMPRGDLFNPRVKRSNRMVVLLVMLFMLAVSRGVIVWLEQPSCTVMHRFSPMKEFVDLYMWQQQVWLKAFGSRTMKPLTIWCSSPIVQHLHRPKPPPGLRLSVPAHCGGVNGDTKNLKGSAAYPVGFGRAVAALMRSLAR